MPVIGHCDHREDWEPDDFPRFIKHPNEDIVILGFLELGHACDQAGENVKDFAGRADPIGSRHSAIVTGSLEKRPHSVLPTDVLPTEYS